MSLLLTAPSCSRPFLCSVLVTCWSHHFFTLLYFAFIEFATMTQHGHRDKKGFTFMKGFTTPPGSMPPWIMGQEKVLDWGELRVLISLTGHSFERQRPGIVEKLTSEKTDSATYLSIRRQLSRPRGIECLHLSHGTILVGYLPPGRLLSWPWFWYCIYRGCLLSASTKIKR